MQDRHSYTCEREIFAWDISIGIALAYLPATFRDLDERVLDSTRHCDASIPFANKDEWPQADDSRTIHSWNVSIGWIIRLVTVFPARAQCVR